MCKLRRFSIDKLIGTYVQKCARLEHLQVQENQISSIAEVANLTHLSNLKVLYLKNIDGSFEQFLHLLRNLETDT